MADVKNGGVKMGKEFTFVTEVTDITHDEDGQVAGAEGYFQVPLLSELEDPKHPMHYLSAHFPGNVVMPGNLQGEALDQLFGYVATQIPEFSGRPIFLNGHGEQKFKKIVEPGAKLDLEVTVEQIRRTKIMGNGVARIGGELACSSAGIVLAAPPLELLKKRAGEG